MSDVYSSQLGFRDRILDRFRLQFLGAGNWKAALANSDMPKEVTSLIRGVVQKTGLLRFEKSEITTELIHHFQDGHERGHSFEELVRDFGTTDVAVSLFRSSKLRSRPMSVKAIRGSLAIFGGGLISYLLLLVFFQSAKPNPTVDYAAELNEAATSMPVEQQAWLLYRDVWAKYGLMENGQRFMEIWFGGDSGKDRLIRPEDASWDKAVAKLESLDELLSVLREGSKLPYVGIPLHVDKNKYSDEDLASLYPGLTRDTILDESNSIVRSFGLDVGPVSAEADQLLAESVYFVTLPHTQQFRRAAELLYVDTRYAMQQGDHDRAIENVETIFGLGKQQGKSSVLVCSLKGLAIQGIGQDLIEELIHEHQEKLSDEELLRLQVAAGDADFSNVFDLSFEQKFTKDMIQRIYSDDGNGDGRITAVGMDVLYLFEHTFSTDPEPDWFETHVVRSLYGPTKLFAAPSRNDIEKLSEEVYEELGRHLQTAMWEDVDFDSAEYLQGKDTTGLLSRIGNFVSTPLKQSRELRIARQDAILLALAMNRYKRSNGQWPTKLEQLKGDWIDRTPIDRLSGDPLSFAVIDDRAVVYSLGPDGDDDGGYSLGLSDPPWNNQSGDGDWILWPKTNVE